MTTRARSAQTMLLEREEHRRRTRNKILSRVFSYLLLTVLGLVFIFPFFWMVTTSFKELGKEMLYPPQWIPDPFTLDNYYTVVWGERRYFPFLSMVTNSAYITVVTVIGRVIVCAMGGYAFARLKFPGKNAAFSMLIASLFLPSVAMIIPLFELYHRIGWLENQFIGGVMIPGGHLAIIMPGIFANTFGTFLMRQFFMTLPPELDDAARIDGASFFGMFWKIAIPLTKPALAALAIFTFQGTWNAFESSRIFVLETRNQTLPVGLQIFNGRAEYAAKYGLLMAGATMAIIPVLIVYSFLQRYFVQGIALTGLKG